MIHTIKSGKLTAQIDDFGAELVSAVGADGYEYIWDGKEHWHHHAPVLFPTCGRLLENKFVYGGKEYAMKSHGFAKRCVFEVVSKEAAKITLKLSQNELTLSEYPFNFELYAEYEVSGDKLEAIHMLPGYTHTIINLSDTDDLVTVMWANEQFDPNKPDTFFEPV